MEQQLWAVAQKLQPELKTLSGTDRAQGVANVIGFLYAAPLALIGLTWLAAATDTQLIRREWPVLLLFLVLIYLFQRLRFFLFLNIRGIPANAVGALDGVIVWTGALLFGPSALWIAVLLTLTTVAYRWLGTRSTDERWRLLRNLALELVQITLASLLALALYEYWDGNFPLSNLSADQVLPAATATLVRSALIVLTWSPFLIYTGLWTFRLSSSTSLKPFTKVASVGLVLPGVATLFAILAAGIYVQNGWGPFLFFVSGLLLVSLLARQLSQAVQHSQQRFRELQQLEHLSRALLNAPLDTSQLPTLLEKHVPAMFPYSLIEIRLFPDQLLLRHPAAPDHSDQASDQPLVPDAVWKWLHQTTHARCFLPHDERPWNGRPVPETLVVAPLLTSETPVPLGGICVAPQRDSAVASHLLPAVQSLASHLSAALQHAQLYSQNLAHERTERELALAGEIQDSFLPAELPTVPGWQLVATLKPARQTAGDFYDFIPLPNGRLGIVVADVADKGIGAALFMALSRTLIRTYAVEHHARPDFVMRVANNRILMDAEATLFVTVFYGVLDPLTGRLTYCNAGHNPPYLFKTPNHGTVQKLTRTGIPLGVLRGQTWGQESIQMNPGDVLLLYTDGVVEAQNENNSFFGEKRLLTVAQDFANSAQELQAHILQKVNQFMGDAAQFDDITLMIIAREV